MCQDIYSIDQIKSKLKPILIGYGVNRAVLFGSYGKGHPTPESDLDILVDSKLKGLRFVGLLEDISEIMGKAVDLFDVTHVEAGSEIDKEIKKTGVIIYER